jgi:protein-tyrosine phosphatase
MPSDEPRVGVLFVCLGNICRSPLAKWIFTHRATSAGLIERLDIDSCGTGGWHAGDGADPRSVQIALERGLDVEHTARKLNPYLDFERFAYLIAMDKSNHANILAAGGPRERVFLMRSFDRSVEPARAAELEVPDPYYGGEDGFVNVYEMLDRACQGLLDHIASSGRA